MSFQALVLQTQAGYQKLIKRRAREDMELELWMNVNVPTRPHWEVIKSISQAAAPHVYRNASIQVYSQPEYIPGFIQRIDNNLRSLPDSNFLGSPDILVIDGKKAFDTSPGWLSYEMTLSLRFSVQHAPTQLLFGAASANSALHSTLKL